MSAAAWRTWVLAGLACGLGAAPLARAAPPPGAAWSLVVLGASGTAALVATAPSSRRRGGWWLALVSLCAALAGFGVGSLRVAAIDAGAYRGRSSGPAQVRGYVLATPHRANGTVSVRVGTAGGRILVEADEPVPDLPIG
ncbi:MAG: hypothetical protein QOJ01_2341, partial [Solirubrobacterales bacterium]|nr:hypothetical protein [Solirubrobacterales bacterium]